MKKNHTDAENMFDDEQAAEPPRGGRNKRYLREKFGLNRWNIENTW